MVGGGSHAGGGGREGPGAGEWDRRGPSEIQTRRLSFSPSAEHDRVASGHLRPGQVLGQDLDDRVDIHGMGVMTTMTGRMPRGARELKA